MDTVSTISELERPTVVHKWGHTSSSRRCNVGSSVWGDPPYMVTITIGMVAPIGDVDFLGHSLHGSVT